MANNVVINNNVYDVVPAIEAPTTDGSYVRFVDVSESDVTAADVARGKKFYNSFGELNIGTAAIIMDTATEKDINFYAVDGACIYSYTYAEFMDLSVMPAQTVPVGYTPLGWSYTLEEAKAAAGTSANLKIGQRVRTNNGLTIIVTPTADTSVISLLNHERESVNWVNNAYSGSSDSNNYWGYYSTGLSASIIGADSLRIYVSGSADSSYQFGHYVRTEKAINIPETATKLHMRYKNETGMRFALGLLPVSSVSPYKKSNVLQVEACVLDPSVSPTSEPNIVEVETDISAYAGTTRYVVLNALAYGRSSQRNFYAYEIWID